jgi:hypothetical protein
MKIHPMAQAAYQVAGAARLTIAGRLTGEQMFAQRFQLGLDGRFQLRSFVVSIGQLSNGEQSD